MKIKLLKKIRVSEEDSGKRLDHTIAKYIPEISRSQLKKYFNPEGETVCGIFVDGQRKKPHYRVKEGEIIEVIIPENKPPILRPLKMELEIIYEDDDILVINKPPGIPVHPGSGHRDDTLANALIYHFRETGSLSSIGGEERPGIVHRLDKDTSGVLIIAKNDPAHTEISKQFSERTVEKEYEAIVKGTLFPEKGVIEKPIARNPRDRKRFSVSENGREAVTRYEVIDSMNETTWVRFFPKTGRTHQIRVHCTSSGHPILGDKLYSRKAGDYENLALFAKSITINHPKTGKKMKFTAHYPEFFRELLKSLGYLE